MKITKAQYKAENEALHATINELVEDYRRQIVDKIEKAENESKVMSANLALWRDRADLWKVVAQNLALAILVENGRIDPGKIR